MPIVLTTQNFRLEVMKTQRMSIVQFKTEWSGASQIMDSIYIDIAKSYKAQIDFYSVDADKERGLAGEYMIQEFPTILFFKNGNIIDCICGLVSKNKLISKIENALVSSN